VPKHAMSSLCGLVKSRVVRNGGKANSNFRLLLRVISDCFKITSESQSNVVGRSTTYDRKMTSMHPHHHLVKAMC
jgi:hypothetical protein